MLISNLHCNKGVCCPLEFLNKSTRTGHTNEIQVAITLFPPPQPPRPCLNLQTKRPNGPFAINFFRFLFMLFIDCNLPFFNNCALWTILRSLLFAHTTWHHHTSSPFTLEKTSTPFYNEIPLSLTSLDARSCPCSSQSRIVSVLFFLYLLFTINLSPVHTNTL